MKLSSHKRKRALKLFIVASLFSIAIGCGAGSAERVAISGKVTFDGQPVQDGQIAFIPQGGGKSGIGAIANGSYSLPADKGPSPGSCSVRITGNRATGRKVKPSAYSGDQTPQEVYEQYLPAKYNDSSELTIELTGESPITHDFDLKST